MSIATATSKVQYTLTATVQALPVTFYFLENAHIKAIRARTGIADYVMILGTDYTLAGAGVEAGGTLTTIATNMLVGDKITITRSISITQAVNYVYNDSFPADTHERALDKLTMIAQEMKEFGDRAIVFPESEPAGANGVLPSLANRVNKVLAFDVNGALTTITDSETSAAAAAASLATMQALVGGFTAQSIAGRETGTGTMQVITLGAGLSIAAGVASVGWLDTDSSHWLRLACGSNLTADRTITLTPGDATRTITLSGNPTLGDWFDQSVKTTASPTFASGTFTGLISQTAPAATNTNSFLSSGSTTGYNYARWTNTSSGVTIGIEGSVGGQILAGAPAYAAVLSAHVDQPLYIGSNNAVVGGFSSTGLAVTGTVTNTYSGAGGGHDITNSSDTSGTSFINFKKANGTTIGSITRNALTDAVLYNSTSDESTKTSIAEVNHATVRRLVGTAIIYDYVYRTGNQSAIGVIAQRLDAANPLFVALGIVSPGTTPANFDYTAYQARKDRTMDRRLRNEAALKIKDEAVLETNPEAVLETNPEDSLPDPRLWTVNYLGFIPLLIDYAQQETVRLDSFERRLTALGG